MYYICKFRTIWSIFDETGNSDQALEADDIERVKKYFGALLEETKILTGLQIVALTQNKRLATVQSQQYLLSKVYSKWVIYDGNTQTDRWLDNGEIAWIRRLLPDLASITNSALDLLVTAIQPAKLLQLSLGGPTSPTPKTSDKSQNQGPKA
jgi:hypothetical protein